MRMEKKILINTERNETNQLVNKFTKCSNSSLKTQLLISRHLIVAVAAWWTGTRWRHNCTKQYGEK